MRGAIVRSFVIVFIIRILRYQPFKKVFQISARGRRRIFHQRQTAARVLNKDSNRAVLDLSIVDLFLNLIGNFVSPFAVG